MRFVVDASTGIHVVRYFRASGQDVLAVAEIMPYAEDNEILALALEQRRVLITNDKDFGELVFRSDMGPRRHRAAAITGRRPRASRFDCGYATASLQRPVAK